MFPLELFVLFAVLVLVPLALDETPRPAGRIAGFGAAAAFVLATGPVAAALAALWLLFTLFLAAGALQQLRAGAARTSAGLARNAALLFLPVGAFWLVLSRLGATPLGFREPVILLTAIHFHYAAFVSLWLLALAGRFLGGRLFAAIVWGTILGTPVVAAGITLWRPLELVGALLLGLSIWTFSALVLVRVVPRLRGLPRALLGLSALSTIPSMVLAIAYAWGRATGTSVVGVAVLAAVHGPLNALGFGLCGLLGWRAERRVTSARHSGTWR